MIIVQYAPEAPGNQRWQVTSGSGYVISKHRKKAAAKQKARQEAKQRNTHYRVQNKTSGQFKQGPGY